MTAKSRPLHNSRVICIHGAQIILRDAVHEVQGWRLELSGCTTDGTTTMTANLSDSDLQQLYQVIGSAMVSAGLMKAV